jgi:hypothetical protein
VHGTSGYWKCDFNAVDYAIKLEKCKTYLNLIVRIAIMCYNESTQAETIVRKGLPDNRLLIIQNGGVFSGIAPICVREESFFAMEKIAIL